MNRRNDFTETKEACDSQQAFFLSECDELRSTTDPLELLIICEDAEDDDTLAELFSRFVSH